MLRYNYSGEIRPEHGGHFIGGGEWMTEEECRRAIASTLLGVRILPDSLRISVQHKKSRWLHLKSGPVAGIFPDAWKDYLAAKDVAAILADPSLSDAVRAEASYNFKKGLAAAIPELEQQKARLEETLAVLHRIQKKTPDTIPLPGQK